MKAQPQPNSLLCTIDMLDITERHGSNLRLKPESGLPFWITADDLPKGVRDHAQHMEACLVLVCPEDNQSDMPLHEGITADSFRKLLASPSIKLIAA